MVKKILVIQLVAFSIVSCVVPTLKFMEGIITQKLFVGDKLNAMYGHS